MKFIVIIFTLLGLNMGLIYAQILQDSVVVDSSVWNKSIPKDRLIISSKVNSNDFNKGVIFSPLQLIQGKVPGFNINCLNVNDPNPDYQTLLRGNSTLELYPQPLYIVNGIPIKNADFIPVESIESIEVLKNISETVPYGMRGADGVIVINTFKNLPTKLNITYNAYGYIEKLGKSDYMTADEWRKLRTTWANSNYDQVRDFVNDMPDYNANTNWLKEVSQNKLSQSHFLDFSGTNNKTSYDANISYKNNNGIVPKIGSKMVSGQLFVSHLAFKEKLQVSIFVTGASKEYSAYNKDINTDLSHPNKDYIGFINSINNYNPTVPKNMFDSTYFVVNPLQFGNDKSENRKRNSLLASVLFKYKLAKGLDISTYYSEYNSIDKISQASTQPYIGFLHTKNYTLKEKIYNVALNYQTSINNHFVNLSLVYSNQQNKDEVSIGDSVDFFNYYEHKKTNNYKIINAYASLAYNYNRKYFFSVGVISEKSPMYSYENSFESLLSLKAGWSLTNEELFKNISWLNELMIYATYGGSKRQYSSGINTNTVSDSNDHGEKLKENTFGANINLFSTKLWLNINYYAIKTTEGLGYNSTQSGSISAEVNDVEIKNVGWEFCLKSQPILHPIKWTFDFNISFNRNTILSDLYISGNNVKNQSYGDLYGYKFAGISNTNEVLVYDNNGAKVTYKYPYTATDDNLSVSCLGNGVPKSFFGFYNSLQFKNLELSISIRGALNFKIRNNDYLYTNITGLHLTDRNFKKGIQSADQRLFLNYNFQGLGYSDYIVEDGDYVKIDNIYLSYTFPAFAKVSKSLKLYIGCNNVALFTKFKGGDPEKAGITDSPGSYYLESYPFTRLYVFGLKCNL